MHRLIDGLAVTFYSLGILVWLWAAVHMTIMFARLDRDLERQDILHGQMLKDHLEGLQELERLRQQRQ